MARNRTSFSLSVISENEVIYYGQCRILFVPTAHEQLAVMVDHTPSIVLLSEGKIVAVEHKTKHVLTEIKKGILYVGDNTVSVLVNL